MLKKRFPISNGIGLFAGSFILLLAVIALPVISSGSTVADCFKTVSGYNAFSNTGPDGMRAVAFAIDHPSCVPPVVSLEPSFVGLSAAMVLAKEAGLFSSEGQCQSAISGPAKKAIAGFLKATLGSILPSSALATLQSIAEGKSQEALTSIPVLGQILAQLPCSCSVAYSGLSITNLSAIIKQEANGIKACGSLLAGAVKTMEEGMEKLGAAVGLSCDHPKINEVQYNQQYLAPLLDKYALATESVRQTQCYAPTGECWGGCYAYYRSGSAACRMAAGNASHLCDVIVKTFADQVMARQPVLVAQALAACSAIGDGCAKNKDYPKMVIDAYGQDTLSACLNVLNKNTYKSPSCKPVEQPCCWRAPWTPELKCKKARAEAASKVGNLGSQIGQSFNNLSTTNADAKAIADRQACQQAIIGNTLKYVQDAACDAAMKTPTDDFSSIWPAVLQAAKGTADGEGYTKCDGPYNKVVRINGCKNKCAQPATLQALYHSTGPAAANQCFDDCMSGAIVGKMPDPGKQQSQAQQQASCVAQCQIICQDVPTSVACQNCKKPNWCGPSSGSGSGTGKPKVGSGGGPLQ